MLSIFAPLIKMESDMAELSERIASLSQQPGHEEEVRRLLAEYDRISESYRLKNGYGYKSEIAVSYTHLDVYKRQPSEYSVKSPVPPRLCGT